MNKRRIIILLLLWMVIPFLSAQPLSLDSCKVLVLRNNAEVKNATLDVLVAREVQHQVLTKFFPNVSAMALGYHALKPLIEYGIEDVGNAEIRQWLYNMYAEYGAALGLPNSLSMCENGLGVGATALQPVFMGGQIVNGNRLAKLGVQAAELQNGLTQDKLLQQVEENYWLVVSLCEKKKTIAQALILLDTLSRDVNAACEAGLLTQNDKLKVTLKQHEMESNRLKVDNGITLATMALCQMIGIEYSEQLQLTDTVATPSSNLQPMDPALAVAARRETSLLNLNVKAEQLKKKMIIGETLPQVMVGVGGSYGNFVFDRYKFNGLAFAFMKVPLTDWWETAHKIKQQNNVIQQAENTRDDLTRKMELETRQAWNTFVEATSQLVLMETAVRDAEANLNTASINFQAGMVPVSELLEAQTLYRQAQDQLIDAKISYQTALLRYLILTKN